MEEKSLTVVKSNKLIEASYRLTLQEQRLILACIGQIDSRNDLTKQDEFKVSAKDFSAFSNTPLKNAYRDLKEAAENLFERRLTFHSPSSDKTLVARWVSSIEYNEGEGCIELCFAQRILPLISQIKGHFTKYKLEHVSNLSSVHAIRIYEMCLQYLKIGERSFEINEIKKTLGLDGQYPEFKDFNKRVLRPSVEQINKYTDIKIRLNPVRKNRKIVSLEFEIESKQSRAHKVSKQKSEKEIRNLANNLTISDYIQTQKSENQKLKKPSFKLQ
jgi:plasmid replication initiation protein